MGAMPSALSAAEWSGVLSQKDGLAELRKQFSELPFSPHAIAALLLHEQPFGFSQMDVQDEEEVSAYCEAMAAHHKEVKDETTAAKFALLGRRHRERAAKIAALLPPPTLALTDRPYSPAWIDGTRKGSRMRGSPSSSSRSQPGRGPKPAAGGG